MVHKLSVGHSLSDVTLATLLKANVKRTIILYLVLLDLCKKLMTANCDERHVQIRL
jgi:hypothetical protein